MADTPRRQYTAEFKSEAVELVKRSGKSQAQIVRERGGSDHNISRWCNEYGQSENTGEEQAVSKDAYKVMRLELRRVT